ncbi:MAG: glycosyl transferase family 2 [Parcubacteria group bacterium GW2011_GWB2_40_8]|nr:MAG: glycosyl transferase family 2 [Parcubacteria group bacterium GW2011_GWF2_40_10]KKR59668.1 MAG: glycosyl transferase family 2 [Parcubacteria group bacterium GW2011_GWC2_40_31]KKR75178.1 MAG: glycosyl transferase family 2 [Parcubacteria group bacterium GW2011_GWB2_40_8]KKR77744.1 MAG: glycosyl transferase family 2 [Parcubacteria group bacterium GW2011_GWE2_40_8]KKR83296.1 MAG: glycosyl transferase family 2 [Parcubacteria group bacterium GW2011_GWD2_40_9]
MNNSKKILVITPSLPFPPTGAEQADRAYGISGLKNLGYEVKVVVKLVEWQTPEYVKEVGQKLGVEIIPVPYKFSNRTLTRKDRIKKIMLKLSNPLLLDGAALEYAEPEIKRVLKQELRVWRPNIVWFDYTYLWPLYGIVRKQKIPIITRSINYEPVHFLQEDGYTLFNLLKSAPKFFSEFLSSIKSTHVFAITPKEEKIYKRMNKQASVLPLRSLPYCLKKSHPINDKKTLNVFFMGSTYNVSHNRKALEFILKEIAPFMSKHHPNQFLFYILGKKVPENYNEFFKDNVIYKGPLYGNELESFLLNIDLALVPSFFGAGMQQKIFEPLARGIPTITSKRGIADYPFKDRTHVYFAKNKADFINCLLELRDVTKRKKLSQESINLASKLFSMQIISQAIRTAINKLLKT